MAMTGVLSNKDIDRLRNIKPSMFQLLAPNANREMTRLLENSLERGINGILGDMANKDQEYQIRLNWGLPVNRFKAISGKWMKEKGP